MKQWHFFEEGFAQEGVWWLLIMNVTFSIPFDVVMPLSENREWRSWELQRTFFILVESFWGSNGAHCVNSIGCHGDVS